MTDRISFIGSEDRILGIQLFGKGNDMFVMHNHPHNSSYSDMDMQFFISNENVKTFSIVKNNSNVEIITKTKASQQRK